MSQKGQRFIRGCASNKSRESRTLLVCYTYQRIMYDAEPLEAEDMERAVSTGQLPSEQEIVAVVLEAYERYRGLADGVIADYIPALAKASASLFASEYFEGVQLRAGL